VNTGGKPVVLRLPRILDMAAAGPLSLELIALRGSAVMLDGSDVESLGGLCLQVMLSAALRWEEDGIPFRIVRASAALQEACRMLGACPLTSAQVESGTS
jgi:chemotaxis protein CheX